jgi:hypothetical protein
MRQEEDRRDEAAAYEAEMKRLARLEQLKEPEPEGITPEQMEYIRDARTKLYWIYKTRNMKELEVALSRLLLGACSNLAACLVDTQNCMLVLYTVVLVLLPMYLAVNNTCAHYRY